MVPIYAKPNTPKRRKKPGARKGHPGCGRTRPARIDQRKTHRCTRKAPINGWHAFHPEPDPDCEVVVEDECEINGWYGDGECDTFCPEPDPDCEP